MATEHPGNSAYSFDLDDTLYEREMPTRALGLAKGLIKKHHHPPYSRDSLPNVSRNISDKPVRSIAERISLLFHAHRKLIPGVDETIKAAHKKDISIYGNTGRPNKREWVDRTLESLNSSGIGQYMQDVFFTPEGVATAVSKAAALRELLNQHKDVSHYEDDPRTAAYLASLFPEVTFYLIHYGTTGLLYSHEEMKHFPNIHRVGHISEIKTEALGSHANPLDE